eukprot:5433737-Amphidinium_carterae.1
MMVIVITRAAQLVKSTCRQLTKVNMTALAKGRILACSTGLFQCKKFVRWWRKSLAHLPSRTSLPFEVASYLQEEMSVPWLVKSWRSSQAVGRKHLLKQQGSLRPKELACLLSIRRRDPPVFERHVAQILRRCAVASRGPHSFRILADVWGRCGWRQVDLLKLYYTDHGADAPSEQKASKSDCCIWASRFS